MLNVHIYEKKIGLVGTAQNYNFHIPHLRYTGFDLLNL